MKEHPYRGTKGDKKTKEEIEDETLFPLSPWVGPDSECPKCGAKNLHYTRDARAYEGNFKKGEVRKRIITKPVFCAPGQRMVIGKSRFFKRKIFCKHPGNHLHQTCTACGAKFVSLPKCSK